MGLALLLSVLAAAGSAVLYALALQGHIPGIMLCRDEEGRNLYEERDAFFGISLVRYSNSDPRTCMHETTHKIRSDLSAAGVRHRGYAGGRDQPIPAHSGSADARIWQDLAY